MVRGDGERTFAAGTPSPPEQTIKATVDALGGVLLRARNDKLCRNNAGQRLPNRWMIYRTWIAFAAALRFTTGSQCARRSPFVIPLKRFIHFGRMSLLKIARRTSRAPSAVGARSMQLWEPCTILHSPGPTDKQTVRRSPRSQLRWFGGQGALSVSGSSATFGRSAFVR